MGQDTPGFGDADTWPACSGHPNDPRTEEVEESSLVLTLGDAQVEVYYEAGSDLYPTVTAVSIASSHVECESFSDWQLESWTTSIRRHLLAMADEARDALREAA